jgi:hypothetical protein
MRPRITGTILPVPEIGLDPGPGSGRAWLQTMTLINLADALAPYLVAERAGTAQTAAQAVEAGATGAIQRGIFGGDR